MFLKSTVVGLMALGTVAWTTPAAPLKEATVAADAKWVLHLDMEAFRKTALGSHIVDEVFEKKLEEGQRDANLQFDTSLKKIQSITAYGSTFGQDGERALLVKTTANVKKDIEALVGLTAMDDKEDNEVMQVSDAPYLLYTSTKKELFVAPDVEGMVILAKSREQVDAAREVLLEKSRSISGAKLFSKYPKVNNSFFFLGMAEGFGQGAQVPPQAQVLKEAEGGRLVIGEEGENLFLNLVLRGKTAEATTRIQQVLQGIVALVSLSQDNPDITQLASSTKISSEDQNVMVKLQVPVATVLEKAKFHGSFKMGGDSEEESEGSLTFSVETEEESEEADSAEAQ